MTLPKKYFTVKVWKKFDPRLQAKLCQQYDIILTDYKTRTEKIARILKKFNKKNLDQGIRTYQDMMADFHTAINKFNLR